MKVNSERIWNRIEELGKIGTTPEGGISRFAFSSEDKLAVTKCMAWMREAGLEVRMDSVGNIYGRREGKEKGPVILTGSHLDTVNNGGKFDGAAGVVAAIAMVMSRLCPIGMVFVRSRKGLSHCPEEYTAKEDLAMGAQMLLNVLIKSADN